MCPTDEQLSSIRKDEILRYDRLFDLVILFSSLAADSAAIGNGIRGVNLLASRESRLIDCFAIHLEPQSSSEPDSNPEKLFHVLVLKCENDLASAIINGAKLCLRGGDHLVISPNTKFQFINSSLSQAMRLRILSKTHIPDRPLA